MTLTYKFAACYQLVRPIDGAVLGRVSRGVYQATGVTPSTVDPYSGTVCEIEGRYVIKLRSAGLLGLLDGLKVRTELGEALELKQVRRPAHWLMLDDPDAYRAFRDVVLHLKETGRPDIFRLDLKVGAAPFDPCPECNDHYGFAEGCSRCSGLGFVPEI